MATTWKVTGDTPGQYDYDGAGNPVVGHLIAFVTGENRPGSVFVPEAHYNPDYIRHQVAAKAAVVDQVGNLASGE